MILIQCLTILPTLTFLDYKESSLQYNMLHSSRDTQATGGFFKMFFKRVLILFPSLFMSLAEISLIWWMAILIHNFLMIIFLSPE